MWKHKIEIPEVEKNNIKKTIAIKKAIFHKYEDGERDKSNNKIVFLKKLKTQKSKTNLKDDTIFKVIKISLKI